jgi:hypothetical protein
MHTAHVYASRTQIMNVLKIAHKDGWFRVYEKLYIHKSKDTNNLMSGQYIWIWFLVISVGFPAQRDDTYHSSCPQLRGKNLEDWFPRIKHTRENREIKLKVVGEISGCHGGEYEDGYLLGCCTYRPDEEAASTSETSANFCQTTQRNNPENSHLENSRLRTK